MKKANKETVINDIRHVSPIEGETVSWTLHERMKTLDVPGVSIAVINNGEIDWADGFGHIDKVGGRAVDAHTLFQAASMSKPVAAFAMMKAVEKGTFDLDADINAFLRSWKVPDNEFTKASPVTLRKILSHTAGLTVWGFGGYPINAPVPSLPELLSGEGVANSPAVFVDVLPGTLERYSGGGTTIAQLALVEAFGESYEAILAREVLEPLGMSDSTFSQPLPDALSENAASGHDLSGAMVKGRWHTFPEQAAAGLWTTAADYARFLIGLQSAYLGRPGALISQPVAKEMATRPAGASDFALGPKVVGRGKAVRFQHGGANVGYRCGSNAFLDGSRGVVVLTNSENGSLLAEEIIMAVARHYDWPDYVRNPRKVLPLDAGQMRRYAGVYDLDPGAPFQEISLTAAEHSLIYELGTIPRRPLLCETPTRFFSPESCYDTVFKLDSVGNAIELSLLDGDSVVLHAIRREMKE